MHSTHVIIIDDSGLILEMNCETPGEDDIIILSTHDHAGVSVCVDLDTASCHNQVTFGYAVAFPSWMQRPLTTDYAMVALPNSVYHKICNYDDITHIAVKITAMGQINQTVGVKIFGHWFIGER